MKCFFKSVATVTRLTQTGDKSSYGASGTVEGYLEPLDSDTNVVTGPLMGQAFRFVCDGDSDVLVTDKMSIDSVSYTVRGTRVYDAAGLFLMDVILELSAKH